MSTLICQVKSRLPIAVVAMYGTLDATSAARMMIALRDVIAEAPVALIIDAEHLVVTSEPAVSALLELARQARVWPVATIGLACTPPPVAEMIGRLAAGSSGVPHDDIEFYGDLREAQAAARKLPIPQRRSLSLQPDRNAPSQARQFVQDVTGEWGVGRIASLAELVASELVTNAVTHARTPMVMTLRRSDDLLSLDVRDGDPRPMFRPSPDASGAPEDEHGRGLLLLDAMADTWGSNATGDGKVVWANVGLRGRR